MPSTAEESTSESSGLSRSRLNAEIQRLKERIQRGEEVNRALRENNQLLQENNNACTAENLRLQERNKEKLKLGPPEQFNRTASKLRGFLIQAQAYHLFHKDLLVTETQRILNTRSYLTGPALVWYKPILKDLLDYDSIDQRRQETIDIFQKYSTFEERLIGMFSNKDEVRNPKQQIENLKQRKSASHYTTEFRQLVARTN